MSMTPESKSALSKTTRGLREHLLQALEQSLVGTYRLELSTQQAQLDARSKARRERLESWLSARTHHLPESKQPAARALAQAEVIQQAASTWLNRLVMLRIIEASSKRIQVLSGGWSSKGYRDFREQAPELCKDASQGYQTLLELVFGELAQELPGLFGPVGLTALVPMPPETLRHLVEELDQPILQGCWSDDLTLGWVYQYWNDPAREALDAKLNSGGKVESHEIASKTQMFTERYMVDWLLQNSLGPMWFSMCRKQGWTPWAESRGTLAALEQRRVDWRSKRQDKLVELTELMPLHTDAERRWAYYVPQPIPKDAVTQAPESVRGLKILDPAVGSGHFLVVAFDLLVALYAEEAEHRGETGKPRWSPKAVAESILENNLHGIDLDPRAVQIAAAALWLKAKALSPQARPAKLNLVASKLELSSLPDDDPALIELRNSVERETGVPGTLTDTILAALKGADHLGSLLKVDAAVATAIEDHEKDLGRSLPQQGLFQPEDRQAIDADQAQASVLDSLEGFLAKHSSGDDLGLRLRGEQLAAGVRFVRLVREGGYDLVVANPPYQGTSKLKNAAYVQKKYKLGKADLYAAFLLRGLELVRPGGVSAMLTMRNWMFIKQYAGLREHLLDNNDLSSLHDLSSGAFQEISAAQVVVSVVSSIFRKGPNAGQSLALKAFDDETVLQVGETQRKRAATLCHVGRHDFDPAALKLVPEWPVVYWWSDRTILRFSSAQKLGDVAQVRQGLNTTKNAWFIRRFWEVGRSTMFVRFAPEDGVSHFSPPCHLTWSPIVVGAGGTSWVEPLSSVVRSASSFIELDVRAEFYRETHPALQEKPKNWFFRGGLAAPKIGQTVRFRLHRYSSVFSDAGQSALLSSPAKRLVESRSTSACSIVEDINPTVNIQVGDLRKLPLWPVEGWDAIWNTIQTAFTTHESHREASVEFLAPGPSPWRHAQDWAQLAVDRPEGAPLPEYTEVLDPEPPTDHLSYALGVALGRFSPTGAGILDPSTDDLSGALPAGQLFLSSIPGSTTLKHPACDLLRQNWATHGASTGKKKLLDWLRTDFLKLHLSMYENKPIHWPLSSQKKSFVAWVNIHRMNADTLPTLLADHVLPERTRLDGLLQDIEEARQSSDTKVRNKAEREYVKLSKWAEELEQFIADLQDCAERGPPPPDPKTPARDVDARYDPDLDDGVMINSAALWPLLQPQWKKPKVWWKELASAKGRKDYDWSHLAAKYWPERVDKKCQQDPSLGVAHGCFWRYHPERAYAWELRLQDEIAPDFTIDESDSDVCRAKLLVEHPNVVEEIRAKEIKRRERKAKKEGGSVQPLSGVPPRAQLALLAGEGPA